MKAQKLEDSSPLPIEQAASTLGSVGAGMSAAERIVAVQALLADDLSWIEQALLETAEIAPAPAIGAARHLLSRGGKRVRPMALLLSAACVGAISSGARELALVSELVHSATLLHDDVIDEGTERRGAPTSRLLYGNAVSVLAGDLLLVHALERTGRVSAVALTELISTIQRLVDGEIIQLRGRRELDLTQVTYERILRDKTASLFAWATRNGARIAGGTEEQQARLAQFGERVGIAFQLVDDVLDYSGAGTGKALFMDLREGKVTLPLVLAVARVPELSGALRRIHAGDPEPLESVSRMVIESGACDDVRKRANKLTEEAVEALSVLPQTPARWLLEHVAQDLSHRIS